MTVLRSDDDANSWKRGTVVYPGSAAYSCLCASSASSVSDLVVSSASLAATVSAAHAGAVAVAVANMFAVQAAIPGLIGHPRPTRVGSLALQVH